MCCLKVVKCSCRQMRRRRMSCRNLRTNWGMSYCHIASCVTEVTTTNGCISVCHNSLWVSEVTATNRGTSYCHIALCVIEVTTTYWDTSCCHLCNMCYKVTTRNWGAHYFHSAVTTVLAKGWITKILCLAEIRDCLHHCVHTTLVSFGM